MSAELLDPASTAIPRARSVPRVRRAGTRAAGLGTWRPSREFALGLWLNSFFAAMIVGRSQDPQLLFAALVAGALLVLWLVRGQPLRYVISPFMSLGVLLLVVSVVVGYALNVHHHPIVFMVANLSSMLIALGVAYLIASRLEIDYARLLAWYSVFAMLLLPVPVLRGEMVWGRLVATDLHPNLVGMLALVAFIGALAIRRWPLKLLALVATLGVILVVSSRASLVGAAIAAAVYACSMAFRPRPLATGARATRRTAFFALLAVLSLVVLYAAGVNWFQYILDEQLKLNDPYRGLSSGASGRAEIWAAAVSLWEMKPIFGVGFKGHTAFMPGGMPAHSAYLVMLADTGMVGLTGYLLICASALFGLLFRNGKDDYVSRGVSLAVVVSYLFYGLVESRGFGFGNPYSIVFLWIAFDASRRPQMKLAPPPVSGSAAAGQRDAAGVSAHSVRSAT
jgi:hypothetical protein